MWSQGFLNCSPSPRGADLANEGLLRPYLGAGMGCEGTISHLTGTLLPLNLKLKVSGGEQPVSAMAQLAGDQGGRLSSWQNLLQHWAARHHPGWGWQGPRCRIWDFSNILTHLPGTSVCCERDTQHICCGGEENICWKSGWIGASSSDFFKISPRSKNSKRTNLQRTMGYFEGCVGSGSQHQGRESRAFCRISAQTWLGAVICITLHSPES